MRFEVGLRLVRAGLIAMLGISMAAGLSWGFGGVGVGVGGRSGGPGVGVGRGGGGGIGVDRGGGDDSGANRSDSAQADFLKERASLEMGMGPRRPDRGIEDALRWDRTHRGWWSSFLGFRVRGTGRAAVHSEVGGKKTGRKGQEGKELGALSKGG